MSRLLWCTALIGLVMPVAAQADGPGCTSGCTSRMPCLQRKVSCLKQKLCDLTPRCVRAPIYQPSCRSTCRSQSCGSQSCGRTSVCAQPQSCCRVQTTCCKKEPEIERIVVNMQQPAARLNVMPMQTVMVPQQRIVMVPQVQTFFTPTTVVGGQAFAANGFAANGFNSGAVGVNRLALNGGLAAQNTQMSDANMRAMAALIQQRLNQRSDTAARSNTKARSLQELDSDLKRLTERVVALENAINK
jgi:hypothetical protein